MLSGRGPVSNTVRSAGTLLAGVENPDTKHGAETDPRGRGVRMQHLLALGQWARRDHAGHLLPTAVRGLRGSMPCALSWGREWPSTPRTLNVAIAGRARVVTGPHPGRWSTAITPRGLAGRATSPDSRCSDDDRRSVQQLPGAMNSKMKLVCTCGVRRQGITRAVHGRDQRRHRTHCGAVDERMYGG